MFAIMDQLTDKQAAIYAWVRRQIVEEFRPPTVREIGAEFGISSPNGVVCHLHALEKKGYITTRPGSRGIRLANGEQVPGCCAACGSILATTPEDAEAIHVAASDA